MRFVVIGGSGFVGRYCIELLRSEFEDCEIVNLDVIEIEDQSDARVKYQYVNLIQACDFNFLPDDIVIHLAARQYHPKPPKENREHYFYELNVGGTQKIIEQMLRCCCTKMIYFSTDMVYGVPVYLPVSIDHIRRPFGAYGNSKKMAEDLIRGSEIQATIFRPRMIVGRGRYGLLEKMFWLMDHNLPIPLIGSGNNCYQMVSVQDCARAICCAIRSGIPNCSLNLGSLNPPSVKELLSKLIERADSKSFLIPTWGKAIKTCLHWMGQIGIELMYEEQYRIADCEYIVDITETQKKIGWMPKYDDLSMLYEAYEEYRK